MQVALTFYSDIVIRNHTFFYHCWSFKVKTSPSITRFTFKMSVSWIEWGAVTSKLAVLWRECYDILVYWRARLNLNSIDQSSRVHRANQTLCLISTHIILQTSRYAVSNLKQRIFSTNLCKDVFENPKSGNLRSGVPLFFVGAERNSFLPAAKNKGTPDRRLELWRHAVHRHHS